MEEKKSYLKQKIYPESPNKNIVPITTTIRGDGLLSISGSDNILFAIYIP